MGYKKYCEKCSDHIPARDRCMGILPPKAKPKRWKYLCGPCIETVGGIDDCKNWLLERFYESGTPTVG